MGLYLAEIETLKESIRANMERATARVKEYSNFLTDETFLLMDHVERAREDVGSIRVYYLLKQLVIVARAIVAMQALFPTYGVPAGVELEVALSDIIRGESSPRRPRPSSLKLPPIGARVVPDGGEPEVTDKSKSDSNVAAPVDLSITIKEEPIGEPTK